MRIYKTQILLPKSQSGSKMKTTNWMIEAESLEETVEVFHKFLLPQLQEQYPNNGDLIEIKSITLQDLKGYFGDTDDSNIYTAVVMFRDPETDKDIKETWLVYSENIESCYNCIEDTFSHGGDMETIMDFETKSVKILAIEELVRVGSRTSTILTAV